MLRTRDLRRQLQIKPPPPKPSQRWARLRWVVPVALICAIMLGAGSIYAGLTVHRSIDVTVTGDSMAVSPETTQGIAMTTGETKTIDYTVTNTSDAPYNVTVTHTQGDGLTVTPNPAAFTLAPDASQIVVVSITATDNISGAVDIAFTSSP